MLIIGIDVAILFFAGIACVCITVLFSLWAPLDTDSGKAAIVSSALTAVALVFTYIIMAGVLDWVIGL